MPKRLKPQYFDAFFDAAPPGGRLPKRFGIVTAYNPLGRRSTSRANRRRDADLRRHLAAMRIRVFRVTGGSEEGSHREPGFGLITGTREVVRAAASLFRQDAYFWVAAGRVYLGASTGGPLKHVGSWSSRRARWSKP